MKIVLTGVAKRPALEATSLAFGTGEAVLARAETEQRPTVLGLLASGRMRPDSGTVTIDGAADAGALRRAVALLDAPDVSDPAPNVTVAGVTAEELMFAGRPSGRRAVMRMLDELGLREHAGEAIGQVAPHLRIRLLVELALLRPGVQGIVLTSPDRHGGDPSAWWAIAREVATRGVAVLVIAGDASSAAIAANSLMERLDVIDVGAAADDADEPDRPDEPLPAGESDVDGEPADPGPVGGDGLSDKDNDPDDAATPDDLTDPLAGHESSDE
jgi:hypothetical protein